MSDLFMTRQQERWRRATAPGRSHSTASGASGATSTRSAPSYRSAATTTTTTGPLLDVAEADEGGDFENLLSLQLRKPQHWKWELSTSRSCTNIALPRILLYNHKGDLLVDLDTQQEQCIRQDEARRQQRGRRGRRTHTTALATPPAAMTTTPPPSSAGWRQRSARAATTNLAHSIRRALDREFDELHIQEATTPSSSTPSILRRGTPSRANSSVDFYTNELPDFQLHSRSSSLKGVRFHVNDSRAGSGAGSRLSAYSLADLPTPPSTTTTPTTTTTTTNSSASGPQEKRRYRRSRSSGRSPTHSSSILERLSYSRGRYSSPDTEAAEEYEVARAPRYYLRSSKAGTLMLRDDSFTQCRRRRRKQKTSSSETLPNDCAAGTPTKSRSRSASLLRVVEAYHQSQLACPAGREGGSLQDISEVPERTRERVTPVRRYRSDGNMLLQTPSTSDDADEEQPAPQHNGYTQAAPPPQRQYANYSRHSKRGLPTIDSGNEVATHPAWDRPTRR